MESYEFVVPSGLPKGEYMVTAVLNYRRMPDSYADYLKVERRPVIEVSRAVQKLVIE
jgi:hypothetical protein